MVVDLKSQFSADPKYTHLCWGIIWPTLCFRPTRETPAVFNPRGKTTMRTQWKGSHQKTLRRNQPHLHPELGEKEISVVGSIQSGCPNWDILLWQPLQITQKAKDLAKDRIRTRVRALNLVGLQSLHLTTEHTCAQAHRWLTQTLGAGFLYSSLKSQRALMGQHVQFQCYLQKSQEASLWRLRRSRTGGAASPLDLPSCNDFVSGGACDRARGGSLWHGGWVQLQAPILSLAGSGLFWGHMPLLPSSNTPSLRGDACVFPWCRRA